MTSLALPVAAEDILPHRLPMRLIDRLSSVEGKSGMVEAVVREDCPLVDDQGRLEAMALVELMAQGYAAVRGYFDVLEQKPVRKGFLVGIKKLGCRDTARAGDCLCIKISTVAEMAPFVIAAGEVWRGETLLASGEIKLWID